MRKLGHCHLTRPISKDAANEAEEQMSFYAFKDGDDPNSKESKRAYREMRAAVKQHNQKFKQK